MNSDQRSNDVIHQEEEEDEDEEEDEEEEEEEEEGDASSDHTYALPRPLNLDGTIKSKFIFLSYLYYIYSLYKKNNRTLQPNSIAQTLLL